MPAGASEDFLFCAVEIDSLLLLLLSSWTAYSQDSRVFVYDVTTYKLGQLLFMLSSWVQLSLVEFSWVELCRYKPYKRALRTAPADGGGNLAYEFFHYTAILMFFNCGIYKRSVQLYRHHCNGLNVS